MSKSNFEFRQQASLSQRTSSEIDLLKYVAGSDPEISDAIAVLLVLKKEGIVGKETDIILKILDALRLSHFATSEKTNEISKMGFMLPTKEFRVIDE